MLEQEDYLKKGNPLSYQRAVMDFEGRFDHAYRDWKEELQNEQSSRLHKLNLQMLIKGEVVDPHLFDSLLNNNTGFLNQKMQSGLSRISYIPFGIDYYAENMPLFNPDFRDNRVGKVIVSDYTFLNSTGRLVRKQSVGIFDLRDGAENGELVGVRLFDSKLLGWRYDELRMQEVINSSILRPIWKRPDTLATADQLHFFGNVLDILGRDFRLNKDYYLPIVVERN